MSRWRSCLRGSWYRSVDIDSDSLYHGAVLWISCFFRKHERPLAEQSIDGPPHISRPDEMLLVTLRAAGWTASHLLLMHEQLSLLISRGHAFDVDFPLMLEPQCA